MIGTPFVPRLWRATFAVALLAAATAAIAAPVGDALDRPAVQSPHAAHAVLLGAAQAGSRLVAVGERGIVVLSDDNGAHWRQVPTPVSVTLTGVRFAGAQHGYAVGHGGTVLATVDGGESWTRRLDGRRIGELALAAAQASGDDKRIKEAQRLAADGPDKPLLDVLVQDARHAIVIGAYGLAFATADGGQTWSSWTERFDNPKGLHLYAIRQHGARILVAGEQGLVRLSDDGGARFAAVSTPYRGSFFIAELPAASELVVAGLRGNIWRSSDAGASWTQVAVPMPASITASAVRADGSLLFANQAGIVLAGRDTLAPLNAQPLPPLNGVLETRGGGLLALSLLGALPVGGTR